MPKDAFEAAAAEAAEARGVEEVVSSMIDDTNNEIFGSAFGKEESVEDETGDTSIEAMGDGLEGQIEAEDEEAEGEADETGDGESEEAQNDEGEAEADTEGEDKTGEKPGEVRAEPEGRVPPGRLREATERARTAEAERDAIKAQLETVKTESAQQVASLKAQFDAVLAALKPAGETKPNGQDAPKPPDVESLLFENPKGFIEELKKELIAPVLQTMQNNRVETSMKLAHAKHGDKFVKAMDALGRLNPQSMEDRETVQRIYNSPDQGEALVEWHGRNETLREVGPDPAAFKDRIAKETRETLMKDPEFRKQIIADLRAEAEDDGTGRPNTTVRLPRSLARANGGTPHETVDRSLGDGSMQAIFDSAFAGR